MTNGCSAIFEKAKKREEMEATSNSPILVVIVFRGLMGGKELQKSGGQELFVRGGKLQTTVESMEAGWVRGEVGSGRGYHCSYIGLIDRGGGRRSRAKLKARPSQGGVVLCWWRWQKLKREFGHKIVREIKLIKTINDRRSYAQKYCTPGMFA